MNKQNKPLGRTGPTRLEIVSIAISALGFLGLCAIALIRWTFGITTQQIMASWMGSMAVWLFSAIFALGFIVLHPVAILTRRSTVRKMEMARKESQNLRDGQ